MVQAQGLELGAQQGEENSTGRVPEGQVRPRPTTMKNSNPGWGDREPKKK